MSKYPVDKWVEKAESGITLEQLASDEKVAIHIIRYWLGKAGFHYRNSIVKEPLTEVEAVWVAAVIDCEGMVTIHRPIVSKKANPEVRGIQYYCRVAMVTTEIPQRLYQLCGGSYIDNVSQEGNRRPQVYWNITPKVMRWLFPQILPYMLVKQRHVEIMIEILSKRGRGVGEKYMTDAELYELYLEVRSLNRKGRVADQPAWQLPPSKEHKPPVVANGKVA